MHIIICFIYVNHIGTPVSTFLVHYKGMIKGPIYQIGTCRTGNKGIGPIIPNMLNSWLIWWDAEFGVNLPSFGWDVKPRPRVNRLTGAGSLNWTLSLEMGSKETDHMESNPIDTTLVMVYTNPWPSLNDFKTSVHARNWNILVIFVCFWFVWFSDLLT